MARIGIWSHLSSLLSIKWLDKFHIICLLAHIFFIYMFYYLISIVFIVFSMLTKKNEKNASTEYS